MILPQSVVLDPNMTTKVTRSWRERLFTLPWRPLQSFVYKPSPLIYEFNGKLVMHPKTYQQFVEGLEKMNKDSESHK